LGPADNPSDPSETTTDDLAVGIAHLIAGAVMNIAGLLFWAAILWGVMADVLGIDLFRRSARFNAPSVDRKAPAAKADVGRAPQLIIGAGDA
jgi:hypothetical protein